MRVRAGTTLGLSTVANTAFSSAMSPSWTVNVVCARAAATQVISNVTTNRRPRRIARLPAINHGAGVGIQRDGRVARVLPRYDAALHVLCDRHTSLDAFRHRHGGTLAGAA